MRSHEEQIANRCRYFTGIQHDACEVGVLYRPLVGGIDLGWGTRLPCFKEPNPYANGEKAKCERVSFPTMAEAKAEAEKSLARLRSMMEKIRNGVCPHCDKEVALRQVGHCVYGSCGHRLYQGKIPRERHTRSERGR